MNFLVAAVTKLPPIKVPYGKRHQEARTAMVRMDGRGIVGNGRAPAGVERDPSNWLTNPFCCRGRDRVGFGRTENPPMIFLPLLGGWRPGTCACRPRLPQPDGDGVRPHAPGVLSPPSGPSALQGPSVRVAQEVSQPGEALREMRGDSSFTPRGRCMPGRGGYAQTPPPLGLLGTQSRRPVGQHSTSRLANDSPRARRRAGPRPTLQPSSPRLSECGRLAPYLRLALTPPRS